MTPRLELLLHPVRMRLVNVIHIEGAPTTREMCAALPDLPKASVYRHVERLLAGGVIVVASERRARGAVERRYRLAEGAARIDGAEARSMTPQDHQAAFTAAMAALIGEFSAYLQTQAADPTADEVSYRQLVLWLTPAERSSLVAALSATALQALRNAPVPGRRAYLLSPVFFPARGEKAPSAGPRKDAAEEET